MRWSDKRMSGSAEQAIRRPALRTARPVEMLIRRVSYNAAPSHTLYRRSHFMRQRKCDSANFNPSLAAQVSSRRPLMTEPQSDIVGDQPPGDSRSDSYPHIYVKDTDAQFTTNQTMGFGRYCDFQPLATGGSAVLRTCRDRNLGRTVVMKTLHPHLANNEYMHSRFIREARVTAQLQHPTTVPVYDLGHDLEGRLYFTMKKVEGRTGREIIDQQSRATRSCSRSSTSSACSASSSKPLAGWPTPTPTASCIAT